MDTLLFAIGLAVALVVVRWHDGRVWAWLFGLFCITLVVHLLKHWIGREKAWQQRPPGACQCDLMESSEANAAGEHGFPSGHAAFAMFYVLGLGWVTRSPWVFAIGLPWVVYVGYSRIHKRCHTVLQVVAGYLVGLIGFLGFMNIYQNYSIV